MEEENDVSLTNPPDPSGLKGNPMFRKTPNGDGYIISEAFKERFRNELTQRSKRQTDQITGKTQCCSNPLMDPKVIFLGLGLLGFMAGVYYFKYYSVSCVSGVNCKII